MQFEVVLSPTKFEPQITQIARIFWKLGLTISDLENWTEKGFIICEICVICG
jgi:hypothetical protein